MYIISSAPHIRGEDSTNKIMWSVVLAVLPAGIAGVWIFGLYSLYVIAAGVIAAVLTEAAIQKLTKRPVSVSDGSAVITGLLLAYNLPPTAPLWIVAIGAFFAIAIAKQTFGGLGKNIFNPALAGRAFLMLSWPVYMTRWANPRFWPDGISSATAIAKTVAESQLPGHNLTYRDLFIGNRGGCIGEVCILAILIGAAFLLYKGYIRWQTPFTYIATVGFLTWAFGIPRDSMGLQVARDGLRFASASGDWLFAILAGGLMLGAFFMATDMVTTPLTGKGQMIFGLGCGIVTFLIRKWGGYPEGVSYSILMMNAATPMIDRFTKPRVFGKIGHRS